LACKDDSAAQVGATDDGTLSTDGSTDGSQGDGTSSADSGQTTTAPGVTTTEPQGPFYARGISIDRVEVNVGVPVPIYQDGAWVDGAGRNAQIPQNRQTLLRAYWVYEDAWEPREIKAVLTLAYSDGTVETASKTVLIEDLAYDGDLSQSFYWVLPAELVTTGVKFQIELFETDDSYGELPEPDPLPIVPPEPEYVGAEDSYMVLRATLVPIKHDIGENCAEAPTISDDVIEAYRSLMHEMNPTELVEIAVREPMVWTQSLSSFNGLLDDLSSLRYDDEAEPGQYYYGVVRPCDGGPDGVGGQAISIPPFPTKSNAWTRTAVGRWYGDDGDGTFVHEIGHTQGRYHVNCNGSEGGPDPSYPYEGGLIGKWGFGIESWTLHSPETTADYMSYCSKRWVSDWGWQKVWPFIKEISSWDFEAPPPGGDERMLLIGAIMENGQEHWFTVPGDMSGWTPTPGATVELEIEGKLVEVPATLSPRSDETTVNWVIELPAKLTDISSITRVSPEARTPVDMGAIATEPRFLKPL
jgi:hypothetical protein